MDNILSLLCSVDIHAKFHHLFPRYIYTNLVFLMVRTTNTYNATRNEQTQVSYLYYIVVVVGIYVMLCAVCCSHVFTVLVVYVVQQLAYLHCSHRPLQYIYPLPQGLISILFILIQPHKKNITSIDCTLFIIPINISRKIFCLFCYLFVHVSTNKFL